MCHFHSVIIERTKFGAKGWNKSYPFNIGDLMCSATVLANYLEAGQSADKVPWSDLRYIFGDILYGGHITDGSDTACSAENAGCPLASHAVAHRLRFCVCLCLREFLLNGIIGF